MVEMLDKKDLYFKNAMTVKVLKNFERYRVEWKKDRNSRYVHGAMLHVA